MADDDTIQAQQSIPADETVMADKTMLQPRAQGATSNSGPSAPSPSNTPTSVATGLLIKDRFRITSTLGTGGMGTVYRAVDLRKEEARDSNPHIAIKILTGELAQHAQSFIMLQREARKSQQLAHPNIITVYDFDRDQDLVYMTMEELDGQPLDELISANPRGVSPEVLNNILSGITAGLEYAHSKQIIHSDLKPSNIFLLKSGEVKVLDFGIARAASGSSIAGDKTVFDAGELGGLTPSYASIEMFGGEDPSPGDDTYALGLIAYELATGRHPYGRTPAPQAKAEGKQPPKRPELFSQRQWRAIKGALALDTEQRLTDVTEFRRQYFGQSRLFGISAVILMLVIATASVTFYLSPDGEPAAVPFESLPIDVQEVITQQLQMANESLKFRDYNAALFHLERVNDLHRNSPEALSLAGEIVEDWLVLDGAKSSEDLNKQVDNLLMYEVMQSNEKLLEIKAAMDAKVK